jgi:hypothetical protein
MWIFFSGKTTSSIYTFSERCVISYCWNGFIDQNGMNMFASIATNYYSTICIVHIALYLYCHLYHQSVCRYDFYTYLLNSTYHVKKPFNLYFLSRKTRNFFPEFTIGLYDKNPESDYFFSLHQNQNIFFSNIGNLRLQTWTYTWSYLKTVSHLHNYINI